MFVTGSSSKRGVRLLIMVVALLIAMRLLGGNGGAPLPTAFDKGAAFEAALKESARSGMPVLVFATADWCGPCQEFKRSALAESQNNAWIAGNTHPVVLDVTAGENEVAKRLRIGPIPTLVMLRDGTETARLAGAVEPKLLREWLLAHSGALADKQYRDSRRSAEGPTADDARPVTPAD